MSCVCVPLSALKPMQTKFKRQPHMGVSKIRGTILGVPLIRTIVNWGLYWGPPHFRKLPHAYERLSPETFRANYALSYIATKNRPYGHTRVPPGPW